MAKRLIFVSILALLATACGSRTALTPKPGESMPPRALTETHRPSADELMMSDDQARPVRNDELLSDSKRRESDRFDLPPPD